MKLYRSIFAALLFVLPLACAGESGDTDNDNPTGTGGSTGGAGTGGAGTGGDATGGGFGTGGFGTGGFGTGGGLGTGGGFGSGGDVGTGGGFGTGGDVGTGGFGTGGDTGTGGDMGTGGMDSVMANPSPGCSQSNGRPSNGTVYKAGESWLLFPQSYDGSTPYPVVVGFHGCGSGNKGDANNTEFKGVFDGTDIGDNYIRALPLSISSGGCYDQAGDMDRAKALFTELVDNYCVDLDRVFGVGHSYGAGFLMGMTANSGNFNHFGFAGIAPVAGWLIGSSNIQVPTLYTQGIMDQERGGGDGADVVAKIAQVNSCDPTPSDFAVNSCNSSSGGGSVDPGCRIYNNCDVETIWCRHNDPAYGTSYHGIPCFWRDLVFDFFEGL